MIKPGVNLRPPFLGTPLVPPRIELVCYGILCTSLSLSLYLSLSLSLSVYIYIYIYIYTYKHIQTHTNTYKHIHAYIHTYIHTDRHACRQAGADNQTAAPSPVRDASEPYTMLYNNYYIVGTLCSI